MGNRTRSTSQIGKILSFVSLIFIGLKIIVNMNPSGMMPLSSVEWNVEPPSSMKDMSIQMLLFNQTNHDGIISQLQARVNKLEQDLIHAKQLLQQHQEQVNTSTRTTTSTSHDDRSSSSSSSSSSWTTNRDLPTCESLMNRPHSPVADGDFLTRSTTPNTWTLRADGSRELQLPLTCQLKRYTSAEAHQCLSNRHISFIGDSISRYQYVSLVYFIERGQYPPRFGIKPNHKPECTHVDEQGNFTCSPPGQPNVCVEGDFISITGDPWQDYHMALGGASDGGMFRGRMECSCVRRNDDAFRNATLPLENLMYVSKEMNDRTAGGRVEMSYISEIGWGDDPAPVRGWNFTTCAYLGTCRTTKQDSDALLGRLLEGHVDWEEPLDKALNGSLRQILPPVDIVIYNRFLWGPMPEERAETIMPLLHDFVNDRHQGRCFYRTTTASTNPYDPDVEMKVMKDPTFRSGCSMLDFFHLTKDFGTHMSSHPPPPKQEHDNISISREREDIYWDSVHFVPWVYEELNNLLLNVLCNVS